MWDAQVEWKMQNDHKRRRLASSLTGQAVAWKMGKGGKSGSCDCKVQGKGLVIAGINFRRRVEEG